MIRRITLLHYLTEDVWNRLRAKFGRDGVIALEDGKLSWINLYNIRYREFGHIWFMEAGLHFPGFECDYDSFEQALYSHYRTAFGGDIAAELPAYDQLCVNYIEYSSTLRLAGDPAALLEKLKAKCAPEQLDKRLWDDYKKPHGTIEFCMAIEGGAMETLARCHGTALKKRITDTALHKTVGLLPRAAVNRVAEDVILKWLYRKYDIIGA